MNFRDTLRRFFSPTKIDPVATTAIDAFGAACDACEAASVEVEPYSTRAKHRSAIFWAAQELDYKLDETSDVLACEEAHTAYQEFVADFTDPADFQPYAKDYLAAHTAAFDKLSVAFDKLTVAFSKLIPAGEMYAVSADLYNAHCDCYELDAHAIHKASLCAHGSALKDQLQCNENDQIEGSPASSRALKRKAQAIQTKAKIAIAKLESNRLREPDEKSRFIGHLTNGVRDVVGSPTVLLFLSIEGEQEGPFTLPQVREMWEEGSIPRETSCKTTGDEWQPLEDVILEIVLNDLKKEAGAG